MKINRYTKIGDIVENIPEAMSKFQEIGMHCMSCALASEETVEEACAVHGTDPDEFIKELNLYIETIK